MEQESKLYARISDIMYLPKEQRDESALQLGYDVVKQDDDRALFVSKETGTAVVGFRGTDLKKNSRMWRDVATDTAVLLGKADKTPRLIANERFLQDVIHTKQYKDIKLTGHSLGGLGATKLGQEYGLETHAYNPAFGIPEIAKSWKDRIVQRKKNTNLKLYTTWGDPISFGVMASLTGKVYTQKKKEGIPRHALVNFL